MTGNSDTDRSGFIMICTDKTYTYQCKSHTNCLLNFLRKTFIINNFVIILFILILTIHSLTDSIIFRTLHDSDQDPYKSFHSTSPFLPREDYKGQEGIRYDTLGPEHFTSL